jgi:ankyrin repeat protein
MGDGAPFPPELKCPICQLPLSCQRSLRHHLTSSRHDIANKPLLLTLTQLADQGKLYEPYTGPLAKSTTPITTTAPNTVTVHDQSLGINFAPNASGSVIITKIKQSSSLYSSSTSTSPNFRGAKVLSLNGTPTPSMSSFAEALKASPRPLTLTLLPPPAPSAFISTKPPPPKVKHPPDLHPLLLAAKNNDLVALSSLLAVHDPRLVVDRHGSNCLHYAAGYITDGSTDAVLLLLTRYNMPVDCTNGTSSESATTSIGSVSRTPFHWACRNGNLNICKLLVARGADCRKRTSDGTSALHWAFWNMQVPVCRWLLGVLSWMSPHVNESNSFNCSAVHFIGLNGSVNCMRLFVDSGGDVFRVNTQGHTVVHKAAWRGRKELLVFLQQLCYDNPARLGWLTTNGKKNFLRELLRTDSNGYTPCDIAKLGGHDELVSWLCEIID